MRAPDIEYYVKIIAWKMIFLLGNVFMVVRQFLRFFLQIFVLILVNMQHEHFITLVYAFHGRFNRDLKRTRFLLHLYSSKNTNAQMREKL